MLSETEHKGVVRIPMIVRISPVVVQPETVLIVFDVEHLRIPVGISFVWYTINATANLIDVKPKRSSCI